MPKLEEFITTLNTLKALSQTITEEQRKGLLQQAVQEHGLSIDEASEILNASGLTVGENLNFFEILGFTIEEIENQTEEAITINVDIAHNKYYTESLRAGGLPRPDGKTQEQWRNILNQARDTLKNPQKRIEHITSLNTETPQPIDPIPIEDHPISETDAIAPPEKTSISTAMPNDMVHIPAGEFQMGSKKENDNTQDDLAKTVQVDAFFMDKYPVTNAQYKRFIMAVPIWNKPSKRLYQKRLIKRKSRTKPEYQSFDRYYLIDWNEDNYPEGKDDHPVTNISWYAAMAYARWIGKRLPTEVEWEKAARGGLTAKKYPWGDKLDSSKASVEKPVGETYSVGKYPANNYGLFDMVGNVWEWCLDEYDPDSFQSLTTKKLIAGENTKADLDHIISNFWEVKTRRILRGGALLDTASPVQTTAKCNSHPMVTTFLTLSYPSNLVPKIGFRCVWDAGLKKS